MNLYDKAIETIDNIYMCVKSNGDYDDNCVDNNLQGVRKALERAKKVEELLKQYQVLAHDYEVLSNNKDRTKLGLLIFAVEEGKRIIKQLEEELK